jgi:hypothetical protein
MFGDAAGSERVRAMHETFAAWMGIGWCAGVVTALAAYAATRAGVRALLAPTLEGELEARADEDRIEFAAVAVTAETRAAVAAMAVLPVVTIGAVNAAHLGDAATIAALFAYAAVAAGGALAFRRRSRVSVGLDGVFVAGTSRARFFAYRDLDGVRASGCNIELLRKDEVVLRLQLHGEDAAKQRAILGRVEAAIARGSEASAEGHIVATASERDLARLAHGAGDYRAPALTREQLWRVVEGAEHDARGRTAAARALASSGDGAERARLRVAAEHCAEPDVRAELEALAEAEADEAEALRAK